MAGGAGSASEEVSALFREGISALRGKAVEKSLKSLTLAHHLAPDDIEIAGALWEAESEMAARMSDMASSLEAKGRLSEAAEMRLKALRAEERAAKLDAISANSKWRSGQTSSREASVSAVS